MDRGKKQGRFITNKNCKIYMNLKDIIRENALPYLPAKSLRRCIGICRDWKLQISTPFFAHSQSNSFRDVSGFFCQSSSGSPKFLSLDQMAYGVPDQSLSFLPEPVTVRCASNGLLCCQGFTGHKAYYICNPVTKRWKKLPPHTADHGSHPAIVLSFEPSLLNFVAEYKLVCAFPSDLEGVEFEIYSSAEGKWRISGEICFGNRKLVPSSGVIAGGIVYWLSWTNGILAFDLTTERVTLHYCGINATIGVVGGKLYSAVCRRNLLVLSELSNRFTNTMGMSSRTEAWKVKQQVSMDGDEHSQSSVVAVAGNIVLIKGKTKMVAVDTRSGSFTDLGDADDLNIKSSRMVPYVNSLVEI
ncbi:F-box protein At5g49610 [Linum perenne]